MSLRDKGADIGKSVTPASPRGVQEEEEERIVFLHNGELAFGNVFLPLGVSPAHLAGLQAKCFLKALNLHLHQLIFKIKVRQNIYVYMFLFCFFFKNTRLCVRRALPHPLKHNDAAGPGPAERLGNVLSKPIYLLHAAPTAARVSARWEGRGGGRSVLHIPAF